MCGEDAGVDLSAVDLVEDVDHVGAPPAVHHELRYPRKLKDRSESWSTRTVEHHIVILRMH